MLLSAEREVSQEELQKALEQVLEARLELETGRIQWDAIRLNAERLVKERDEAMNALGKLHRMAFLASALSKSAEYAIGSKRQYLVDALLFLKLEEALRVAGYLEKVNERRENEFCDRDHGDGG